MKGSSFTASDVKKIAQLAHIPVTDGEASDLASGFTTSLTVVDAMQSINVEGVDPTSQVTGLENVFREDEIDTARIFSQDDALKGAKRVYNGFFVVDQILEE